MSNTTVKQWGSARVHLPDLYVKYLTFGNLCFQQYWPNEPNAPNGYYNWTNVSRETFLNWYRGSTIFSYQHELIHLFLTNIGHENGCGHNVMNNRGGGTYLYPRQIGEMHDNLQNSPLSNYIVSCTPSIQLTQTTNYGPNGIYHADQTITCDGDVRIEAERSVVFHAGDQIELKAGFEVKPNSRFVASIQSCTPEGFVGHN